MRQVRPYLVLLFQILDLFLQLLRFCILPLFYFFDLSSHNVHFLRSVPSTIDIRPAFKNLEAGNCQYRTSSEIFISSISSFFSLISVSFS